MIINFRMNVFIYAKIRLVCVPQINKIVNTAFRNWVENVHSNMHSMTHINDM